MNGKCETNLNLNMKHPWINNTWIVICKELVFGKRNKIYTYQSHMLIFCVKVFDISLFIKHYNKDNSKITHIFIKIMPNVTQMWSKCAYKSSN